MQRSTRRQLCTPTAGPGTSSSSNVGIGQLQLGAPRWPLPLEGAGVGAVGVTTEARNLGWNLHAAFGPTVPGWTQRMPAGFSARSRAHSGCLPGLGFLKISGAARRRCDWPRPGNLYANEAAPPPRRRRPTELAGKEGAFAAGLGGRTQSRAGRDPRSHPVPACPPRKGDASPASPPPPPGSPPRPSPRLPVRTTFHPDRL